MGDRCTVMLYMREVDVDTFGKEAFASSDRRQWADECDDEGDGVVRLVLYDSNYAAYKELEQAAKAGCVFYGEHGAGDEYGPSAFVALNGNIVYVDTNSSGRVVVPYGGCVEDQRAAVLDAKRYTTMLKEAKRKMAKQKGGSVCPKEK